ncbi:hypothetical protein SYJ56_20075 [Algoriphagus sp. D3-2-R+10]|uniref:hypothetical protein n=1 Tax=Algoriphagus aurantiacus TaxID=3103948 RepID=UPI002B3A56CB|nr:hypothetical protein [Algoriphagus sp. D3-2-R+10]MEB2777625.1 hypothetical protein [Algoriphagus sp. D3-2-R+10]
MHVKTALLHLKAVRWIERYSCSNALMPVIIALRNAKSMNTKAASNVQMPAVDV